MPGTSSLGPLHSPSFPLPYCRHSIRQAQPENAYYTVHCNVRVLRPERQGLIEDGRFHPAKHASRSDIPYMLSHFGESHAWSLALHGINCLQAAAQAARLRPLLQRCPAIDLGLPDGCRKKPAYNPSNILAQMRRSTGFGEARKLIFAARATTAGCANS